MPINDILHSEITTDILLKSNFSIDSRTVQPGDIFIALKGNTFDGNDFIYDAFKKGAILAITENSSDNVKIIPVPNVYDFLYELASKKRSIIKSTVIAITGSVGKTTTKETIYSLLNKNFKTFRSYKNFNNKLGLTLNILNTPNDSEYAVYELGINHMDEMRALSDLVRPDISVITGISEVHIEFFGSLMNIAKEKGKILESMSGGSVILFRDTAFFDYFSEKANTLGITVYGYDDSIAKALASALKLDIKNFDCNSNITQILPGRGDRYMLENGAMLIDHSYNASIESVRYSIKELSQYTNYRKILVLGDMKELGDQSMQIHEKILPAIDKYKIDKVFLCGENMQHIFDLTDSNKKGYWSETAKDLLEPILENLTKNDVISIKGSHSMNLNHLARGIIQNQNGILIK